MPDPVELFRWQRLSDRITTSGRLAEADFDRLVETGVRHVINLVPPDHPDGLRDEGKIADAAGLGYTCIPVPFDAPDEDQYAAFVAALGAVNGPVHVHCIVNWRVSAFMYRWHRDTCGMDESAARELMEQQWSPLKSDHRAASEWARFCGLRG